jgi:hypothetical protein
MSMCIIGLICTGICVACLCGIGWLMRYELAYQFHRVWKRMH